MAQRYSKQREVIAANLKGRHDHPSADMVYEAVKEELPRISMGTVYRNLRELTASGEAISFMMESKERFDGNAAPHFHICCDTCGNIWDEFRDMNKMQAFLDREFTIRDVVIHGTCSNCINK